MVLRDCGKYDALPISVHNGITPGVARSWVNEWLEYERQGLTTPVVFEDDEQMVDHGSAPTFNCDTCEMSTEMSKLRILRICPSCNRNINEAIKAVDNNQDAI